MGGREGEGGREGGREISEREGGREGGSYCDYDMLQCGQVVRQIIPRN